MEDKAQASTRPTAKHMYVRLQTNIIFQVEDEAQASIVAARLAAAAEQPGPGRRAVVDAGGTWALLHLAKWQAADIQREAARGLHSLVTHVPLLCVGLHDPARRLLTFPAEFPHRASPTLSAPAMADAGFFWLGFEAGSDRVVCYACGVIIEGLRHASVFDLRE